MADAQDQDDETLVRDRVDDPVAADADAVLIVRALEFLDALGRGSGSGSRSWLTSAPGFSGRAPRAAWPPRGRARFDTPGCSPCLTAPARPSPAPRGWSRVPRSPRGPPGPPRRRAVLDGLKDRQVLDRDDGSDPLVVLLQEESLSLLRPLQDIRELLAGLARGDLDQESPPPRGVKPHNILYKIHRPKHTPRVTLSVGHRAGFPEISAGCPDIRQEEFCTKFVLGRVYEGSRLPYRLSPLVAIDPTSDSFGARTPAGALGRSMVHRGS